MKKFFHNNGLSLVLGSLFLIFWVSQAVCGWHVHNDDLQLAGRPIITFAEYLRSGHFWQATGENWESEFLQMGFYVVLTVFLYQKGSAESKDPDEPAGKQSKVPAHKFSWLYRNSLSLAFLMLFVLSFSVHFAGGLVDENEQRAEHGQPPVSPGTFLAGSHFWFQSFQNWQSEFLAVLSIVTFSIFLRQKDSPESKPLDAPNSQTGD